MATAFSTFENRRLFRTVTALGAELRRQGALGLSGEARIDLIDLAYAAIAAAERREGSDVVGQS